MTMARQNRKARDCGSGRDLDPRTPFHKFPGDLLLTTARRLGGLGLNAELADEIRRPANEAIVRRHLSDLREALWPQRAEGRREREDVRRQRHRLIHGRFTPLQEKLEMVKRYPGVTEKAIAQALTDFEKSDLRARYEAASPTNPFLDAVITVYRNSVPETPCYARDRMRDTFGDQFEQWEEVYGKDVDENRVRLLEGVPDHRNTIRIEVVDLAHGWAPKDGFIPKDIRNAKSASFAVIYAAAQNPEWVRQMDGKTVPYALTGGLELNVPGYVPWAHLPLVWRYGGRAGLSGGWYGHRYRGSAMPSLWE